jgi:hypothetical protein
MQRRLSSLGRLSFTALLGLASAVGCEAIAGYNDVEPRPPGFVGGASGATGASGASARGGTGPGGSGGGQVGAAGSGGQPNLDARPDSVEPDSSGGETSADVSVDTGPEDVDSGPCPILVGGNACTGVHRFTASRQVIDSYGDEFCDIPAMVFDVNDCPTMIPGGELPDLPEKVYLRVAWSQRDFHLHVRVVDPNVVVNPADTSLWNGDAIEVYIAGTSGTGLTGSYDGTDDGGAIQIVLAPPGGGHETRGQAFFNPGDGRHTSTRIDKSSYAGRLTDDGYELELIYTWALIAEPRVPGAKIAFDLAVGAQQIADAGGRQLQCIISNVFVDGALACGYMKNVPAQPWCDDRTWCQPELLP